MFTDSKTSRELNKKIDSKKITETISNASSWNLREERVTKMLQRRWARVYKNKNRWSLRTSAINSFIDLHIIYASYTISTSRYHISWKGCLGPFTVSMIVFSNSFLYVCIIFFIWFLIFENVFAFFFQKRVRFKIVHVNQIDVFKIYLCEKREIKNVFDKKSSRFSTKLLFESKHDSEFRLIYDFDVRSSEFNFLFSVSNSVFFYSNFGSIFSMNNLISRSE